MKKVIIAWVLSFVLLFSIVGVASAVTDGELDENGHPYVGLAGFYDENGEWLWRCSGTLISENLFLTAGHCTEIPAVHAEIWFDADIDAGRPDNGYPDTGDAAGVPYTHPDYYDYAWFTHDLGVIVLDQPYVMEEYGILPQLNQLDAMKTKRHFKDNFFTAVGYGLQASFPNAASWKDEYARVRMVAYPHLIQINTPGFTGDFSLLLSNNHATGGTCFGDSGGPNFIGETRVIAGVTSYGMNPTCAGTGGVYRIDKADDLDWLESEFGLTPP